MTQGIAGSLSVGGVVVGIDNRDNSQYLIGRLADGKCWMLDNLALDLTNSTVQTNLTSTTTNASDATLAYLKGTSTGTTSDKYATSAVSTNWTTDSFSDPLINTESKNVVPNDVQSTAGNWKVGVYYNYCAASAGSYCYGNGDAHNPYGGGNILEDVCPSGWHMPIGSRSGEYSGLANAVFGSISTTNSAYVLLYRNALRLPLSGIYTG
jgi:uncharacterized protein (TIGR02145 family)